MNTLKVIFLILFMPFILLYVIWFEGIDNEYREMRKREESNDGQ